MIREKFLQFMTATCSLGHRLITPDQAWKHAEAICFSPYQGALQCCLINSTAQHPIENYVISSVQPAHLRECGLCSHVTLMNNVFVWTTFTTVLQSPLCVFKEGLLLVNISQRLLLNLFEWTAGMLSVSLSMSHRTASELYVFA